MTTVQYWKPLNLIAMKDFCKPLQDFEALVKENKDREPAFYEKLDAAITYIKTVAQLV